MERVIRQTTFFILIIIDYFSSTNTEYENYKFVFYFICIAVES